LKILLSCSVAVLAAALVIVYVYGQTQARRRINLPTSKILDAPIAGRIADLNSFPATIALSPDRRYAALLNDGYGTQETFAQQSIAVLDLSTNQVSDFPDARLGEDAAQSYFLGLAFSSDGKHLYASMGSITDPRGNKPSHTGNGIAVYGFADGKIRPQSFLKIPPQQLAPGKLVSKGLFKFPKGQAISYPAGMTVLSSKEGDRLLVANNLSDNVILMDVASGRTLESFDLSTNSLVPSSFPYTVVATRDGRRAWCSLWNASRVAELDLVSGRVVRWIVLNEPTDPTLPGSHPTALLLSPDEKLLYVALANADGLATVDVESGKVLQTASTNMPNEKFQGTFPNALAQSVDGSRVFVADASLNAVAVFNAADLAKSGGSATALGFIPTEWYPSALAVHGDDLLIATAKGQGSRPNNGMGAVRSERRHREHPYILTLLRGSLARLNYKKAEPHFDALTGQVQQENLMRSDPGKLEFHSGGQPIKHVIYVLKENRTYDQIFGDLGVGDGDPSLTMYGEQITPNEHKLARQFGVLDNFYDSGEVSGDGHIWSSAAITSDYNEKTWQIAYRSKERTYDYQGTVADEYMIDHNESDVDDPATGFLWGNLTRNHKSYRIYGEFITGEWCTPRRKAASPKHGTPHADGNECPRDAVSKGEPLPANVGQPHGSSSPFAWRIPLVKRMVATKPELRDHFDSLYPDFNTDYPDQLRADEFLNEFDGFVTARKQGTGTELPAFVLLYLPDDHTAGKKSGSPSPTASVADNDLALGRVVETVSHSPYWADTAIFVIEDDAQDGADHVDAHRSIALVISKYSPGSAEHPFVAHQFYTTVNMVHTMEALLDLPPMNQNDAYAPIMSPLFSGAGNQAPFTAEWRNRDNGLIYQANPLQGPDSAVSNKMDFSRPDAAKASALNAVLWRDRKGNVPVPSPRHSIFPVTGKAAPQ
jgi:DNA-binding beta-propeller fold protein YncE